MAEQSAREANERYRTWTKASLTLGTTLAIALPLISALPVSLPSSGTGTGGKISINDTTIHPVVIDRAAVAEVADIAEKAADAAMADVAEVAAKAAVAAVAETAELGNLSAIADAISGLEVSGKNINMAPSIVYDVTWASEVPRQWYKTTFSKAGDEFWALPDASFTLELVQDITQCDENICNAEIELRSSSYLAGPRTINVQGGCNAKEPRCLVLDNRLGPMNPPGDTQCRVNTNKLIPEYVCRFVHLNSSNHLIADRNSRDLCVSFRRSEMYESRDAIVTDPHVALEVKWERVEFHNVPADNCQGWNTFRDLP